MQTLILTTTTVVATTSLVLVYVSKALQAMLCHFVPNICYCTQTTGVLNVPRQEGPNSAGTPIVITESAATSTIDLSNISALPLPVQVEALQSVR